MNKDNMLSVANRVEERPGEFDMRALAATYPAHVQLNQRGVPVDDGVYRWAGLRRLQHGCNTAGCVAGYAAIDAGGLDATIGDIFGVARAHLGLTEDQAERLFNCCRGSIWFALSDDYGWDVNHSGLADWSAVTAGQAAEVLRRIASGEIVL